MDQGRVHETGQNGVAANAEGHTVLVDVITSPEAVSSDSKTGLAIVPDFQALSAWDDAERNWLEEKH